jgi:hypothetical protein
MAIYVASSWRCPHYEATLDALRAAGLDCYDFKTGAAFHWSDAGVNSTGDSWARYTGGLVNPVASKGFAVDRAALDDADSCILVLPAGRSVHLEAGYAIGKGKPTAIYHPGSFIADPELMYLLADFLTSSREWLIEWAMEPLDFRRRLKCTDCGMEEGWQHRPTCHRQGVVTSMSDYLKGPQP